MAGPNDGGGQVESIRGFGVCERIVIDWIGNILDFVRSVLNDSNGRLEHDHLGLLGGIGVKCAAKIYQQNSCERFIGK